MSTRHHANGKLLISGEYFVLDGALALALPVALGQSLEVHPPLKRGLIHWRSLDVEGASWFEGLFSGATGQYIDGSDAATGQRLEDIFQAIFRLQPGFALAFEGAQLITRLEFDRHWGLGSSSTLLALLAHWSGADAYQLLRLTFGGSGYDLACALATEPIFYQLENGLPQINPAPLAPVFHQQLYFVYLNEKQNSRLGIQRYHKLGGARPEQLTAISRISQELCTASSVETFSNLLLEHEQLVSQTLDLPRAQQLHFPDFPGVIKSLGAWGGDFVLAVPSSPAFDAQAYFEGKGFGTIFPFAALSQGH